MTEDSLYWNVYRQLEKDFLSIAEILHIDDKQINVYSMRIADLLLRTVVEIEALSKKLYFDNGGDKANCILILIVLHCLKKSGQLVKEKCK